jgi:hydrogenase maturation protease
MTGGVLVVGYGNSLRSDDGLGRRVAERLADDPRLLGAVVLARHQLTPELALDLSQAELAVFVDASREPAPGAFTIERLIPAPDMPASGWSHQVSPASLVALAAELYGRTPEVVVIQVGVETVEVGEGLSRTVEAALPRVIDTIAELVQARTGAAAPGSSASPVGA